MKDSITPSTEVLFNLFYQALQDPDAEVYSNAAFGVGLLVEHSAQDLSLQYSLLLSALLPLFEIAPGSPPSKMTARDNAAGAVGRIIVRNTTAVPLEQVLPIFIGALPLTNDFLGNRPVFRALFHLFRVHPTALTLYIEKLLSVFGHVLDPSLPDQLGTESRSELVTLMASVRLSKYP